MAKKPAKKSAAKLSAPKKVVEAGQPERDIEAEHIALRNANFGF